MDDSQVLQRPQLVTEAISMATDGTLEVIINNKHSF